MGDKRARTLSLLTILMLLSSTVTAASLSLAASAPTVWTDKQDYAPGETVVIYGTGFPANKKLVVQILRPKGTDLLTVQTDASGSFTIRYKLSPDRAMEGTYTILVIDPLTGEVLASTSFTDSPGFHVDWAQGHDDTSPHDGVVDTPMVTWSNGDINKQNSLITEGNIVPPYPPRIPGHVNYRAIFGGLPIGTYVLTIQYDFTKGGIVAVDFLTTNYGVTDANLQTQLPSWVDAAAIAALVSTGLHTFAFPADNFGASSELSGLGGGTVADRQAAHDAVFAGFSPRTMKIYGADITDIAAPSHTGSVAGDSSATVAITFSKETGEDEPVIATWSGHLGIGADWPVGYGAGNGAASISGAPFHMSLASLSSDGQDLIKGDRDRSVQPRSIVFPGSISGHKFEDMNGNGLWDGTEPSLNGWTVELRNSTGGLVMTAVTGGGDWPDGYYNFTGLAPGTYTVSEILQQGWIQSYPSGASWTVTLQSGQDATNKDFGNFRPGNISGHKFEDLDGDGDGDWDKPGEPPLQGWTIKLWLDQLVWQTTTDENGYFEFTGLVPGDYVLTEVMPDEPGWVPTLSPPAPITVVSGTNSTDNDFGNFKTAEIWGQKWEDVDGEGDWDYGEPVLSGWTIKANKGPAQKTYTTTAQGYYTFQFGPDETGTWTITELLLTPAWIRTYPSNGSYEVVVASHVNATGRNFGNFLLGSISGYKFEDMNGDGDDDGEPRLNGWTIKLYRDVGGAWVLNKTDTTDPGTGYYNFTGLGAGDYLVNETLPGDWVQTNRSFSIGPATYGYERTVQSNSSYVNLVFGNYKLGKLSGFKFNDTDGDGDWDGEILEPFLRDWNITLSRKVGLDWVVIAWVVTNGSIEPASWVDPSYASLIQAFSAWSGAFNFTGLPPGSYRIDEIVPDGWTKTSSTPFYEFNPLLSGADWPNLNFGNFKKAVVEGYKWNDTNGDGIWDGGELALDGWTIEVRNPSDDSLLMSAVTGAGDWPLGYYNFTFDADDVGSWNIGEVLQTGWTQTYPVSVHPVYIQSGAAYSDRNFGNFQNFNITVYKYEDITGDGKTEDDPPIQDWSVTLQKTGGVPDTELTDEYGKVTWLNLGPGEYNVTETVPPGWVPTSDVFYDFNATSGLNHTVIFTNFQEATVIVYKFEDEDGNITTGDWSPVAWSITLWNSSGPFTEVGSTVTFPGQRPGTVTVTEADDPDWVHLNATGTWQETMESGRIYEVIFVNFHNVTISGHKWNDTDGDGIWDPGEQGLSGWTVWLKNGSTGADIASNTTIAGGYYEFTKRGPGSYVVNETDVAGWVNTTAKSIGPFAVSSGDDVTGLNFGNFKTALVEGYKWNDLNGDGIWDAQEQPLSDWTIEAENATTGHKATTTGAGGYYSFTFGPEDAGTWTISEQLKDGWTQTWPLPPGTYTVNIWSGAIHSDRNFGNFQNVNVSVRKLNDTTGDGWTNDDQPLAGWWVQLWNGSAQVDGDEQTGLDGWYNWTNLGPGNYTVMELVESGWTNTSATSHAFGDVTSGHENYTFVFNNFKNVTITVRKFNDTTGNGWSPGDEPLAGWTMELWNYTTKIDEELTDGDGTAAWPSLGPGSYKVVEVMQPGWWNTSATSVDFGRVESGGSYEFNFTNFRNVTISGYKLEDITGNGASTDDVGIEGWKIWLKNNTGDVIAETTTGAGGYYQFTGIGPGWYTVNETDMEGWEHTSPTEIGPFQVISGIDITGLNFTNFETAVVEGYKWNDTNGDGIWDQPGELPLSGWTIEATNATVGYKATTTGAGGYYSFTFGPTEAGEWDITEKVEDGLTQTAPEPVPPGKYTVIITSGATHRDLNFGNFQNVNISVRKLNDTYGDGETPDDQPLAAWTVQLWNGSSQVDGDKTTGADGWYNWTNLGPGNYTVKEIVTSGWTNTSATSYAFGNVTSGHENYTFVFTNFENVSITVRKFNDLTGNGWSADDTPLQGWNMTLWKDGVLIDNQTTGADGSYTWPSLGPGSYNVTEIMQQGWTNTSATSVDFGQVVSGESYSFNFTNTMPPGNATRTQGYWATHTNVTQMVFDLNLSGYIEIDTGTGHFKNITADGSLYKYGKLFGAFWSSIPYNSTGARRTAINQSRMILLQQLVAAILNHAAFGTTIPIDGVTGLDIITAGHQAYSGENRTEILRLAGLLDAYNQSGDDVSAWIDAYPGATPALSRLIADRTFWDNL